MKAVFADTFYWIALTLPGDAAYARAEQVTDDIVTTEEVLTEYLNFFCASPEYLRREAVSEVLTNDRHFGQEGFRALFRDS